MLLQKHVCMSNKFSRTEASTNQAFNSPTNQIKTNHSFKSSQITEEI